MTTTLIHSDLPDRDITVRDEAVSHYARSGWRTKKKNSKTTTEHVPVAPADLPATEKQES